MKKLKQFEFGVIPEYPPKNKVLYHYTNSHGLFGITKSGSIWATKLQFLNDIKEFKHAVDVAKNELNSRKAKVGVSKDESYIYDKLNNCLESMSGANTFVASFSEEPDLLSQWRAYGGKGGFSIGFNYEALLKLAHQQSFRLLPCIYELKKQQELISYLIDEIKNIFLTDPSKYKDFQEIQHLQNKFYSPFLLMASTMKHHSFHEEKEWRIIGGPFRFDSVNAKWRPKENMLLPYYIFNLDQDEKYAIDHIYIGPNNQRELVLESTRSYIGALKKGWQLKYSDSPYRIEN